jgi:metal-dependent HD superfamily phosphatase/phosphodiesterase
MNINALEELEKELLRQGGMEQNRDEDEGEQKLTVALDEPEKTIKEEGEKVIKPTRSLSRVNIPARDNRKLYAILERVNADIELHTLWRCANINAVDRLGISDHGRVHVQIVANIALKMLRLLREGGVTASIVKNYDMRDEDAEIVVVLGALLHDLGICVHRDEHEHHSLWLADNKLKELLEGLYDLEERTIIKSEVLHTIIAHARSQRCLTVEAGIVKVADALDMAKGRSRIPFEAGHVNIHSVSAAAIESIELKAGEQKPIHIRVKMGNSAGIFQLDELLKNKIKNSSIKDYLELVASINAEQEEKLIELYQL